MVLQRNSPVISHHVFHEIEGYLCAGDVLVLNRTKVPPCRIRGRKPTGGMIEFLLLTRIAPTNGTAGETWECLVKPASRTKKGQQILVSPSLAAKIHERLSSERWSVEFFSDRPFAEILPSVGLPPLPPYIRRPISGRVPDDRKRYQTVFADREGGVAAPTAGFHFTKELMAKLRQKGIRIAKLTLFPGTGSFQPVRSDVVLKKGIPPEEYNIDQECADLIGEAKTTGHRVIAVGTTTVRALESGCVASKPISARNGRTSLCIFPGYAFNIVDALITNFHLPRSTHLFLVSAFIGRERLLKAYSIALEKGYRFLSFGDAMLIL